MQLKKINPNLQKALIENDLIEANELQQETFSSIKSGVDAVIQSLGGSGKTTTILLNVIQRMEKPLGESTRALVLVQDKEKVLEAVELLYSTMINLGSFSLPFPTDIMPFIPKSLIWF